MSGYESLLRHTFVIKKIWEATLLMFDPTAHMLRINRGMIYLGACLIAGIRLAGTNR